MHVNEKELHLKRFKGPIDLALKTSYHHSKTHLQTAESMHFQFTLL